MELTKEQFEYWKHLPETKIILDIVAQYAVECRDQLASGSLLDCSNAEKTALETAKMVGVIQGLSFVGGIDYQ